MNIKQDTPDESYSIREEPAIKNLLARMPVSVANSFSDTQLMHLKTAIGSRSWGKHAVDVRGTLSIPMTRWRYYYVFLLGRNRRQLSDREKRASFLITSIIILFLLAGCSLVVILGMYLIKSAAGIDLFPSFSLGIWDYFKNNF